jgi:hypothetical protein
MGKKAVLLKNQLVRVLMAASRLALEPDVGAYSPAAPVALEL